ncbi:MAG: ankyrin repeat domain-containing protein [Bacteroidia bacterium]|nr:ankyrin repeat domain-containing protein [Bacteroidia bacterium]
MNHLFCTWLAQEFFALNARVQPLLGSDLIGPETDKILASNFRLLLQRYLPESLATGYGLILGEEKKTAFWDVIIYKKNALLFHREGNFIAVNTQDVVTRFRITANVSPSLQYPENERLIVFGEKLQLLSILPDRRFLHPEDTEKALGDFLFSLLSPTDISTPPPVVLPPIDEVVEYEPEKLAIPEPVFEEAILPEEPVLEETFVAIEEEIPTIVAEIPAVVEKEIQPEEKNAEEKPVEEKNLSEDLVIPVKRTIRPMTSRQRTNPSERGINTPSRALRVNGEDSGNTPLHEAVMENNAEKVEALLAEGLPIESKNRAGFTPLHLAVRQNLAEIAEVLIINGADVNSRNYVYDSPLHLATVENHFEMVQLLIENGAEVEVRNNRAHTPLHKAAIHGSEESAEILIKNYADIHARMEKDMQPLHLAAWYGQGEIARILIEYGADMNAVNIDGNTALHFAAFNGQVKAIKVLINNDADPTITNKSGETYLQSINEGYRGEMIKVLE